MSGEPHQTKKQQKKNENEKKIDMQLEMNIYCFNCLNQGGLNK